MFSRAGDASQPSPLSLLTSATSFVHLSPSLALPVPRRDGSHISLAHLRGMRQKHEPDCLDLLLPTSPDNGNSSDYHHLVHGCRCPQNHQSIRHWIRPPVVASASARRSDPKDQSPPSLGSEPLSPKLLILSLQSEASLPCDHNAGSHRKRHPTKVPFRPKKGARSMASLLGRNWIDEVQVSGSTPGSGSRRRELAANPGEEELVVGGGQEKAR